ncbi:DUF3079 domain-containing protein [archaeon]|nr:MAG: DUF3079 domain-containing protein [archaeon]
MLCEVIISLLPIKYDRYCYACTRQCAAEKTGGGNGSHFKTPKLRVF